MMTIPFWTERAGPKGLKDRKDLGSRLLKTGATLAAFWALSMLTGCNHPSAAKESGSPVRLTLLVPGGSIKTSVEKELVRLRQEHPEIEVEVVTAPGKDYYVKGLAMMAAGAKIDLLWVGQGLGLFSFRGALMDLSPLLPQDPAFDLNAYFPPVVDWYRHQGRLYGVPYGIDVQAIAYNQDAFDRAGLPYPDATWTFAQYVETARTLTQMAKTDPALPRFGAGIDLIRPFYFDLKLLEDGGTRFGLNNRNGREWLQLNVDVLTREESFVRVGAQGALDRLSEFFQQRAAMVEVLSWDLPEFRRRASFRWDIVPNPLTQGGRRVAWGSSSGFSIAAGTAHPAEAWIVLKALVSDDFQRSTMATTVPTLLALQAEYITTNGTPPKHLDVFLESLPALEPTARIPAMMEVAIEWDYWTQLALQEGGNPAVILDRADESISRILAEQPR